MKRPGSIVAALLVLGLVLAAPAAAARPDFRVKSVRAAPDAAKPFHAFIGRSETLHVTVVNEGDAPGSGGGLGGDAFLRQSGGLRFLRDNSFQVTRIRPGRSREFTVDIGGKPMDVYATKVCVSVRRDSNRGNNCRRGPDFAQIPRTWKGAVSSLDHPGGQPNLNLDTGATATFRYERRVSQNTKRFVWSGTGSLDHTISGTDNGGCTWSGQGSNTIGPGEAGVVLKRNLVDYNGFINTVTTFPATVQCGMSNFTFPVRTTALNIYNKNREEADELRLHGTATAGTVTYRWDLDAD